jgi:hypothetical protein
MDTTTFNMFPKEPLKTVLKDPKKLFNKWFGVKLSFVLWPKTTFDNLFLFNL